MKPISHPSFLGAAVLSLAAACGDVPRASLLADCRKEVAKTLLHAEDPNNIGNAGKTCERAKALPIALAACMSRKDETSDPLTDPDVAYECSIVGAPEELTAQEQKAAQECQKGGQFAVVCKGDGLTVPSELFVFNSTITTSR